MIPALSVLAAKRSQDEAEVYVSAKTLPVSTSEWNNRLYQKPGNPVFTPVIQAQSPVTVSSPLYAQAVPGPLRRTISAERSLGTPPAILLVNVHFNLAISFVL